MTTAADPNKQIVELRAKTGAGMMDCKKALSESKGDFEGALTILRKKGLADAAKKSGRATKEGVIAYAVSGPVGAIVELNCETDFVARNEEFQKLGQTLAEKYAKGELNDVDSAKAIVQPVFMKLGENMGVRRFEKFQLKSSGMIQGYIHQGAKAGALIEMTTANGEAAKSAELRDLGLELLLQIVGSGARYLKREEVPPAEIEKEKEIYSELLRKEGKPEASIPKIVEGKINKLFYQSLCLLDQMWLKDSKVPVSKLISDAAAKMGGGMSVARFARYQLGE